MSADLPTKSELERGITVEVEQENGDRIVGEVGTVLEEQSDHPEGVLVKLKSGVEGRVKQIHPE